ncbi:MAG: hypothetical protein WAT79_05950 [Saprospiraceae bacterium]
MKKFFFLGLLVAATLVSCKEKAAEEVAPEAPVEAVEEAAPAVDTTAMPADTTMAQ